MIRHELARILRALADRLEVEKPAPGIQYVYVYSQPPPIPIPSTQPWQSPFYYGSTAGAVN